MSADRDPSQPMSVDDIHANIAHCDKLGKEARAEGRHVDAITFEDYAKLLRGMLPRTRKRPR